MSKFVRFASLMLVLVLIFPTPVFAEEISPRASQYFASYGAYIYQPTTTQLQIWFDVIGNGVQDEIGVNEIILQRKLNGTETWTTVKTFLPEDYPQMLTSNNYTYSNYVPYTGTRGYHYRAIVTFYAAKGTGYGLDFAYTASVYVPISSGGSRSE